jgi:hypothetical protein
MFSKLTKSLNLNPKYNKTQSCITKIQAFIAADKENVKTRQEILDFIKNLGDCRLIYNPNTFKQEDDPNDSVLQAELSYLDNLEKLRDKQELEKLSDQERQAILRDRQIEKDKWHDAIYRGGNKKRTRRNKRKSTRKSRKSKSIKRVK